MLPEALRRFGDEDARDAGVTRCYTGESTPNIHRAAAPVLFPARARYRGLARPPSSWRGTPTPGLRWASCGVGGGGRGRGRREVLRLLAGTRGSVPEPSDRTRLALGRKGLAQEMGRPGALGGGGACLEAARPASVPSCSCFHPAGGAPARPRSGPGRNQDQCECAERAGRVGRAGAPGHHRWNPVRCGSSTAIRP